MPAPLSQTTGRRKQAVARVRFRPGQGAITVNQLPIERYFTSATHRMLVTEPLRVTSTTEPRIVLIAEIGEGTRCALAGTQGFDPVHGMRRQLRLPPDAPPGLLPTAPSRAVDPARSQKVPDVVHRLVTGCGQNPSPCGHELARGHGRAGRVHPLSGRPAVGSSMEGTSGAADPGPSSRRNG
jgi:hypothetical protein